MLLRCGFPPMMNLLLVEDDAVLGKAISQGLQEAGHQCEWVTSGQKGADKALEGSFHAIVLDIMLPDLSGMEVLSVVREQGLSTPVLVLTALGSIDERVAGLESGADDYLVKPFAFPELLARLNAITRRFSAPSSNELVVGPLSLNVVSRQVVRDGQEVELTPTEFRLLEFLMRNAGNIVTRKMLCEHVWESHWEGVTNVIEVHVTRLRAKVDRNFESPLIHTVRGRGYVLKS